MLLPVMVRPCVKQSAVATLMLLLLLNKNVRLKKWCRALGRWVGWMDGWVDVGMDSRCWNEQIAAALLRCVILHDDDDDDDDDDMMRS